MMKSKCWALVVALMMAGSTFAQIQSHYESYQYSPFDRYVYKPGNNFHTSVKFYRMDELKAIINTDSVLYDGLRVPAGKLNFWKRILHDDLIKLDQKDVRIVINPLFDFNVGKESVDGINTWTNTRGLFIEGNIGKHFYFYTDFLENQAVVPNYIDQFANDLRVMPGQGQRKKFGDRGHDYAYVSAYMGFNFAQYFNIQFGNGKHFFGDGHRSLLLSDVAFNYPYVKLTADFWKIKYTVMYNKMLQYDAEKDRVDHRYPGKYGVFQYLDMNIGKRASIGFFASVVYAEQDSTGYRGFDMHYLNPIAFLRPVEYSIGSPDNVTMGLNARYIAADWLTFYGQFVMGEFKADEVFSGNKWWANKQGFQLGFRTFDLFGLRNLDVQGEYNQVRPYTYSHYTAMYAYGHYQQPLAHILGANFSEALGLLRYRYKRWMVNAEVMVALYGDDDNESVSWGKDVFKPNTLRPSDYDNEIGQGVRTHVYNAGLNLSYLINPRNMFNVVAGVRVRRLSTDDHIGKTRHFYFGLRTSLKSIYNNF